MEIKTTLVQVSPTSQMGHYLWLVSSNSRKFKWTKTVTDTLRNKKCRVRMFRHRKVRYEILWK